MSDARPSIARDFGWVFSSNAIYSACQWLIVLLFSKFGSPEQLGEYALGVAIVTPILLLANLQMRNMIASDVDDQYSFSHYLSFRVVTLVAAFLILAVVVVAKQHTAHMIGITLMVGVGQVLEYVADTYYGLIQKLGRLDRISRSAMIKGPFGLLTLTAFLYFTHDVFWAVTGLAIGRLIVVAAYDSRLHFTRSHPRGPITVKPEFDSNMMRRLLRTALPFGVTALLASLTGNIPRYFIEGAAGPRGLGIFTALYSLVSMGTLFINAFGQSVFMPAALAYSHKDAPKFRKIIGQFTFIAAALGAVAVAVAAVGGKPLLTLVYRREYADRDLLIQIMIAGGIYWTCTAQGYILTAVRVLKGQIVLLAFTLAGTAAACAWLVPKYGVIGAAHALQISAIVQLILSSILLWKTGREIAKAATGQRFTEALEIA